MIIVCAGEGRRLGGPKASYMLEGKPLFYYSLRIFLRIKNIEKIILVLQEKHFGFAAKFINSKRIFLAPGGKTRKDSVKNGLNQIEKGLDYVLIHDCARPFVDEGLVLNLLKNLKKYSAVVPGLRMADTLKEAKGQLVKKTLPRVNKFLIQTPQGFRRGLIKKVYSSKRKVKATDSSQLVEKEGRKIKVIEGSRVNFKITYPQDIILAKLILKNLKKLQLNSENARL